jgi:hypothetical protein
MNWIDIDIEDNCEITCLKCSIHLIELKDIDIYGSMSDYKEGPKSFLFLRISP